MRIAVALALIAGAAAVFLAKSEPRILVALVVGCGVATIVHQIGKAGRARRAPARAPLSVEETKKAYESLRNIIASAGGEKASVETALLLLEAE